MHDTRQLDFLVRRDDLNVTRWHEAELAPLAEGEVLLRVERYGLTTNNVTYARVGETIRYWQFFPAPEGWGRVPVWGFAEVAASRAPGVSEGERFFGYLPMSSHLRVRPEHVNPRGFSDASPHRRELSPFYQRYQRVLPEERAEEDVRAILAPLFGTGFLLDTWLFDQGLFGARQIVFASASSKTALSTAYMLSRRPDRDFTVVGLTSPRHRAFCERVGYYDQVVEYPALASLPADTPTAFVDMAGDEGVLRAVHEHFTDLRHSCQLGFTHATSGQLPPSEGLPGPRPAFFSAPSNVEPILKRHGPQRYSEQLQTAQSAFFASVLGWMQIVRLRGQGEIESAWREALSGRVDPARGVILGL